MNKNNLQKLQVFLSGVASRLAENALYFISGAFSFRSGAKTFPGTLSREGDGYRYTFGGESRAVTPAEFTAALLTEAARYDALTLVYRERGATLTVEADERGVRTRQNEENAPEPDAHDAHLLSERDYILRPAEAAPLLRAIGLRREGVEIISCPTCGRARIDVISLSDELSRRCTGMEKYLKVAVMGCAVNGPGEAREADFGAAFGKGSGILFAGGKQVARCAEHELVDALVEMVRGSL